MTEKRSIKNRVNINTLAKMKRQGEKITMLTAYDASFARVLDRNGVDIILVGDSLGMVVQGHDTTLPVTVDDMVYHAKAVDKGITRSMLIVDLPFMTYTSTDQAIATSMRLMQEGMAHMVKIEGGGDQSKTVSQLTQQGVPVCAHLGLTPQSVHKLGGFRVQGRSLEDQQQLIDDALSLQAAGADALVLECIPAVLAKKVTHMLEIPTIGIGAGVDCDGQVLVLQDMLGLTQRVPRFVRNFIEESNSIDDAIALYVNEVKNKHFPSICHQYV